jgi:hypothetical protein
MIRFAHRWFKLRDVISFYCQIEFEQAILPIARRAEAAHPPDDAVIIGEDDRAQDANVQLLGAH